MKGIMIYGNPMWGDNARATYCEYIDNASFEISRGTGESISCLEGETSKLSKTVCSKKDTYDFETGALIALMKMCRVDKVVRAFNEVFPKERYNTYVAKLEGKLNDLKKDFDKLGDRNKYLIEDINKKLEYIKEKDEEIKKLKSDKDKSWKNYQRNIQKKQDRINELEAQIKASEDDKQKNIEYYEKEIKKLRGFFELYEKENKDLKKNIDELFESEKHSKSELGRLYFEKHRLEEEVEILKLDCEKLQHGYVDIDNVPSGHWDGDILDIVFLPGRACGKQYKTLVDLFKKIDQKKVDAAYKEVYNTTLPVWQKEFLNRMYGIYKESKEKIEPPRTLDINGTVYRKSIQIKDFGEQINKLTVDSLIEQSRAFTRKCVDEWLYKIPTKREEMWEKIFKLHKKGNVIIVVEKEDVTTFLHEIENKIPEITWASCVKIFETKYTIGDIYEELKTHDTIYFRLSKQNTLTYSSDAHIYQYTDFEHIPYLPPMRWDLFKKGRLAVKVTYENYKGFYDACEKELGKKPCSMYCGDFTVSICKKDGKFEVFTIEDQKSTGRKIVNWEDVR